MRKCFLYSMMTNKYDLTNSRAYNRVWFVEFLEFICRISYIIWDEEAVKLILGEELEKKDVLEEEKLKIEKKVEKTLQILWAHKLKNEGDLSHLSISKRLLIKFPEFIAIPENEPDSDDD